MKTIKLNHDLYYECHECVWEGYIMDARKIWYTNNSPNLQEGQPKEYVEVRCPDCNIVLDECVTMEYK